jgi:hypothetical protein
MKMYVPSAGRADERLLAGPLKWDRNAALVVPAEEAPAYRRKLFNLGLEEVAVLECPEAGIAATRHWIGKLAASRGEKKFCMADDDIGFLVRKAPDHWPLRAVEKDEYDRLKGWISKALDDHAHASLSGREGNNRIGNGPEEELWAENTRTLRVLAYRTEAFLSVEHGRVAVMEDFDVNLQLLRAGHSNICSYWWAQGQRMTNEKGGCSTYRSHEVHEASAKRLAELHPGLVRLRQKHNKTDAGGFGTRTEVTISWKRAYEEGARK